MSILQKLRERKRRRKTQKAIESYNEALQSFAEAATKVIEVARELGILTAGLESALTELCNITENNFIRNEDLQKGGETDGKK